MQHGFDLGFEFLHVIERDVALFFAVSHFDAVKRHLCVLGFQIDENAGIGCGHQRSPFLKALEIQIHFKIGHVAVFVKHFGKGMAIHQNAAIGNGQLCLCPIYLVEQLQARRKDLLLKGVRPALLVIVEILQQPAFLPLVNRLEKRLRDNSVAFLQLSL